MAEPLDRKPLAERVADTIAGRIQEGEWPDGLPGYRILAARFEVSWRTARKALEILEERGQLSAPAKGKSRQVRKTPSYSETLSTTPLPGALAGTLLVITSSRTILDLAERTELSELMLNWTSKGGKTQQVDVDYQRFRKPASYLRRLINNYGAEAILMREAPRVWVNAAIDQPLPLYFLGGDVPSEKESQVSGYSFSVMQAITDTVKLLRSRGHERIIVPNSGRSKAYREAVLAGIRAGFGDATNPLSSSQGCPYFAEHEPEAWQRYWKSALQKSRATAVITATETGLLSLHGYCSSEGWKIPDDLSVICLSASETLQWFHPPTDYMAFPCDKARSLFRQWLHGGLKPMGMRVLPIKHAKGGSLRRI